MKAFVTAAGLVAGATAAVLPRDQCCFQLTASGGQSGQLGQLGDGQNRVGGSYLSGTYCLSDSTITDGNGRGCILTPPTTQFQCDEGATPDSGFSVGEDGQLEHDGDSTFYACAADEGEYNVYTETSEDQTKCSKITLSTSGECSGSGSGTGASSQPASQPASSAVPSPPAYSAPASSPAGPESTVPASSEASAPGYSEPAPSAPAPSALAPAPSVSTRIVTQYTTVCECSESAPGAPSSAPGYSAPPSAPAPPGSAPAPGTPAPSAPAPPQSYPTSGESSHEIPAPSESTPETPGGYTTHPATETQPAPGTQPALTGTAPTGYTSNPPTETQPASSAGTGTATGSGSTCQTSLVPGSYETPHLIVPVNSQSPDTSYGTTYIAYANGQNSTVFNFDIPESYSDKTCTMVFLFPKKEDLETTDYTFNGQGSLQFAQLTGAVDQQTTYSSCPSKQQDLENVTPQPGNSYIVKSGACAAGTMETVQMTASGGLEIEFFEDWNPSPLGLFITVC